MSDYGDGYYFQTMRAQKPGASDIAYPPYMIVSDDSTVVKMGTVVSDGVRSAGFNGAIKSDSTGSPDLSTSDWVGVADEEVVYEFLIFRRAPPESSLVTINAPGARVGSTYENGWTPTRHSMGTVVISPPTGPTFSDGSTDPAWDSLAYSQSATTAGASGWGVHGGGHRDYAWSQPTSENRVYRGDVIVVEKVTPTGVPNRFDNLSGNYKSSLSTKPNFYPHTYLPRYYHAGDNVPTSQPIGQQAVSADYATSTRLETGGLIKCIPDVMNQHLKAREGSITVVFKRNT